jgi:hypothetical protein
VSISRPYDISRLECSELKRLFDEANVYAQGLKIEIVPPGKGKKNPDRHPADLVGLNDNIPTIRIVDSLNRQQQIEAISHELVHLLLVYRFGMGLVTRRHPSPGDREAVLKYFFDMDKDWFFLLGQIGNTTHHLFLIDYLKKECGIESDIHGRLLHQNFCILASEVTGDVESLYAKGIIAFEYERLIGHVDRAIISIPQPQLFWRAYHAANERFGSYRFPNLPAPSIHAKNVFAFLRDLGYPVKEFVMWPEKILHSRKDHSAE